MVKKQWQKIALSLFLACGTVMAGIGLMSTSGYLISLAALRPMIVDLFMVTAAIRFFGISRAVVRYFEKVVSHDLTFRIMINLRRMLFDKINERPLVWLMGKRPGDLLARLISDTDTLQNACVRLALPVLVAIIISSITVIALWILSPGAALATFATLAVSGAGMPIIAIKMATGRDVSDNAIKTSLKVLLIDKIQGMQELAWMASEQHTREQIENLQQSIDSIQKKNAGISGILEGLNSLISNTGMVLALIIISPMVLTGQINGAVLALVTLGVLSSFEAVIPLGQAFLNLGNAKEAFRRVSEITAAEKWQVDEQNIKNQPGLCNIKFNKVGFSYHPENITLNNISFEVPFGSKTAIVGPSGSGKSTLVNLLLRFWETNQGAISFGNTNISKLNKEALRSNFCLVQQDAFIFNRSLRENLLIAKPDATLQELKEVMHAVALSAFTNKLDMAPGSHGLKLSGGERQLLAMARALLKNAPVWVMDEPTANLDVNTERLIINTMWKNCPDKTLILITHRLIDMEYMDQIIVMNRGRIEEKGTHHQLLAKGGLYAKMYQLQLQIFSILK